MDELQNRQWKTVNGVEGVYFLETGEFLPLMKSPDLPDGPSRDLTDDEREGFVSSFRRKCESRVWLTFYVGGDDMERAYINVGAWGTIRTYLDLVEP